MDILHSGMSGIGEWAMRREFYINEDGTKGEHCLDEDLRILVLKNQKYKAIELYMDLISNDLKEAEDYVDNISKNI